MSDLRILVVDDAANWQKSLKRILKRVGEKVSVDIAATYDDGLQFISNHNYDLAIFDLALQGDPEDLGEVDELGMALIQKLRKSSRNTGCNVIMLTGYGSTQRTRRAFKDFGVFDLIEKESFDDKAFIDIARAAILDTRFKEAARKADQRYRLTITFDSKHFRGSELSGPDRRANYVVEAPHSSDLSNLARRADNLNLLAVKGGPDLWRPDARSIGKDLYEALNAERRILGDLIAARALAGRFSDLWLRFSGPAQGLGIPFELLRDGDEYLGLNHILTRHLVQAGTAMSRKTESFNQFLERLLKRKESLRILIVGANVDGKIPSAEQEAEMLSLAIAKHLQFLGLMHEITCLTGSKASYGKVRAALETGRHHIFHYAGHGYFKKEQSEVSGLVLAHQHSVRILTAADLNLLLRDSELHFVFLSCCLGARNEIRLGRGDFHGMLEAIARADVPAVIGYRWTVADNSARLLAHSFYEELWRTLSLGEALLHARRQIAMGKRGRDDETWASPVLLIQNM